MVNSRLEILEKLHGAIVQADMERVRQMLTENPLLVCAKDENGRTPLHLAAVEGNAEAARFLLSQGAEVEARDRWGLTPLFVAIYEEPLILDRVPLVQLLIESGADIQARDAAGDTPLHMAALGETEIAALLLEHGADANAVNDAGETPLHKAVQYPEEAIVSLLLRYGSSQERRNAVGLTPAQIAERRGWTKLVALLGATPVKAAA